MPQLVQGQAYRAHERKPALNRRGDLFGVVSTLRSRHQSRRPHVLPASTASNSSGTCERCAFERICRSLAARPEDALVLSAIGP